MGRPCEDGRAIGEFYPDVIDLINPSTHFGQDFYISGVIRVVNPFTFDDSNVFMGENAGFDVTNTTLEARNETIISAGDCDGLWRGINVFNNGQFVVNENDEAKVQINDAVFAVRPINAPYNEVGSTALPQICLNHTAFNQNYIGFRATDGPYVWRTSPNTTGFDDVEFIGGMIETIHPGDSNNLCPVEFDINEFIPLPPALPNFSMTTRSYAGVVVDGLRSGPNYLGLTLDGADFITPEMGELITYSNLAVGVFSDDANVTIEKSLFLDMWNLPDIPNNLDPTGGGMNEDVGIRFFDGIGGNNLIVNGLGETIDNFTDMRNGIVANMTGGDNTSIFVEDNKMDLVQFGVSIVNKGGNTDIVDIRENTIGQNF